MAERGGKRAGAGRKAKPKIGLFADKGIASKVLHSIDEEGYWRTLLRADTALKDFASKLTLPELRLVEETMEYLTNRRDGKPAQGVFVGDTRESAPPLSRGSLPNYFSGVHAPGSDKTQ